LVFVYLITRQPSREFEVYFLNWATEISSIRTVDEYRRWSAGAFAKRRSELADRFGREFPVLDVRSLKQFQRRYLLGKLTQHVDLSAFGATSAGHQWLSRYCDGGANQIEHILPQTPTALIEAEFGSGATDAGLVWSIGNLALAESSINQSLGNTPFSHKGTVYPQSQFRLTRAISERPNIGRTAIDRAVDSLEPFDAWNAVAVRKRAEMLTRIAQEVWDVAPVGEAAGQSEPPRSREEESETTTISVPTQSKPALSATQSYGDTKSP
jgi:hypothetical protein